MKTMIFFSSYYKELQNHQVNMSMKIAYTCTMILSNNNKACYSWNYCWFWWCGLNNIYCTDFQSS